MQAVILAAGKGTRMGDATLEIPKPLLEVNGKTLLEHKFDAMPAGVDEIIVVIGWMGIQIQERFGESYRGIRMRYVEQEVLDGTMGALSCAKNILRGRFLVMMGDDIYAREDMDKCLRHTDGWSLVVHKTNSARAGGAVVFDSEEKILAVKEGEHEGERFTSTNLFSLDTHIFDFPMVPKAEGSREFGLPQTALAAAASLGIPLYAVATSFWIQVTSQSDLEHASVALRA